MNAVRITISTLTDGGQRALDIAGAIAAFLDGASGTLDLAQYDFDLGPETAAVVGDAFRRAAARGSHIRFAYNVDHAMPIPVPPPPRPDQALIARFRVAALPIAGVPDLMHHKYVVRDGEAVWTGSTNWSDDSWTRQENVIVVVESPPLAAAFQRDFDQLWATAATSADGHGRAPSGTTASAPGSRPGYGEDALAPDRAGDRAAHGGASGSARRCSRRRPCSARSPQVVAEDASTSPVRRRHPDGGGRGQWRASNGDWKLPAARALAAAGPFAAKPSTPYGSGSVHDFMHAKLVVADDTVFIGLFNLSRSGERNAENVLEIEDAALAERLAAFVDAVRSRYGPSACEGARPLRARRCRGGAGR